MATVPPTNPQMYGAPPQPPVKKGLGPLAWVLIILGSLFMLFVLTIMAAGFFIVHKVKQAGLDPDLMKRNPGLAVTKLITTVNPDTEVLNVDESRGIIHIRSCNSRSAADMINSILERVDAFTAGAQQHDDMTLVVMRVQ